MSAEFRHKPMRMITIRFPDAERAGLLKGIETFAQENGFALRLSNDANHSGELSLQLYRGDMKMIGATDSGRSEFDIALYKTPGHPAPMWALDRAVSSLWRIVEKIPNVRVSQEILATYDPTPENRSGQLPLRAARTVCRQALASNSSSNSSFRGGKRLRHSLRPDDARSREVRGRHVSRRYPDFR